MSHTPRTEDRVESAEPPRGFLRRRWPELVFALILVVLCMAIVAWMAVHLVATDQVVARKVGRALPVQVEPAAVQPLRLAIGASGTVSALNTITLTARVNSRVARVPVDIGDVVRPGDLLARLDDQVFTAGVASAKAAAEHAEAQLQRMETLEKRGYGAAADTEKARSDAATARQVVVQSEIDLGNTSITAPVSAVVVARGVNPGEITRIDQAVFQLGPIDQVYMVAEVPTDKMGYVTTGMTGEVSLDSFPGEIFKGTVVKMDAVASVTTRTYSVYLRMENPGLRIKPGVTGYARLERSRTALAVPSVAILNPVGDAATVYVVDREGHARVRQVRPGIMAGGLTEILDGLQEGEKVVTVGQLELKDGDSVSTTDRSTPWNR